MKVLLGFGLFIGLMGIVAGSSAAVEPIEVSAEAQPQTITVGDEITFTVTAKHVSDVRVFLPGSDAGLAPFEMKRYRPVPRREEGGLIVEGGSYHLTIFELGTFVIPSVAVDYVNDADRGLPASSVETRMRTEGTALPRKVVKTQPIPIIVRSLLHEKQETAPVVQPPVLETKHAPGTLRLLRRGVALLAVVGLFSLLAYGVFYFWPKAAAYRAPTPPHQTAEKSLKELTRMQQTLPPAELSIRASEILRRYLASRFDALPLHLSTAELLSRMQDERLLIPLAPRLSHFFEQLDLIKFATHPISAEEGERSLQLVREVVVQTTPREEGKA